LYYYQVKPELCFRRVELSGGTTTKVADWAYGKENWARVDPHGQSAVYTVVGPKGPQVSTIRDLATGRERPLAVTLTRSEWSPDGQFILGESGNRENGAAHITICRASGDECRDLTAGLAPKWSADSLSIYYLRAADQSGWFDLWHASRAGTGAGKIATLGPFRGDEIHFDVSREGRIVWAPRRQGRQELWLADLN
jgi:hypothetical protein